jgi:hypothetical protein
MKDAASKTKMVAKNLLTMNASMQHLRWLDSPLGKLYQCALANTSGMEKPAGSLFSCQPVSSFST